MEELEEVLEPIEEVEETLEYKDLKWNSVGHTSFDVTIKVGDSWLPYTCNAEDDGIGSQLWAIRDTLDIEEYVTPVVDIEDVRSAKLLEISRIAGSFEQTENKDMVLTSSLGFRVNADPKAKRNIDTLIELRVQAFRDYDNQDQSVTLEDLETIKREISLNALNLYNQKWTMQAQVMALETIEDIKNYEIKFEMLNFNK